MSSVHAGLPFGLITHSTNAALTVHPAGCGEHCQGRGGAGEGGGGAGCAAGT